MPPWRSRPSYLARALAEQGMFEEGDAHGHEAMRIAEALDHPFSLLWATWSGRIEEGISLMQEALTAYESAGVGYCHSISVAQLGEAYLLVHRVEDAGACADRAVTLARARGDHGYEAWALRLLGDVTSHQSRLDVPTAEAHYGAARGLASELGMRPLTAHRHLGLGKLYARTAERERPKSTSPRRPPCTARWTWASGWSRRRRRWERATGGHPETAMSLH